MRRRLLVNSAASFLLIRPLHGLANEQEDLSDPQKKRAFFTSQKNALKVVKQVSRTLTKGAPKSPLGDFVGILKWTKWADESIDTALRNEPVKAPPGGLCSGFTVPSQAVIDYIASITDSHNVNESLPDYNALVDLQIRPRRQRYRQLSIDLANEFERSEDYQSSRDLLDQLGEDVRGYKLYYEKLRDILAKMVEYPVYFISRQAITCWFSLEASVVPDLTTLETKVETALADIDTLESERAAMLKEWAAEHLFAVEIEEFEIDAYLLEIEAGKAEFEQLELTIEELVADSKILKQAKELAEVNFQAAELDRRNLQDQSFNFVASKQSLQNQLKNAQDFDARVYDRCPNGNDFADCTHDAIKANWSSQKSTNRNRISQLRNDLATLDRRIAQGDENLTALDQAIRAYKLESEQIESELAHITLEIESITQDLVENIDLGGLTEDELLGYLDESRDEAQQVKVLLAE